MEKHNLFSISYRLLKAIDDHFRTATLATTQAFLLLGASIATAGPKEDCAFAVEYLGSPTSRYSFVEAGIFTMERHIFNDTVICYVNISGKIDSIYRGEYVIMEDGYYSAEALEKRDVIEEQRRAKEAAAYAAYQDIVAQIAKDTEQELKELRKASDPFINGGTKMPPTFRPEYPERTPQTRPAPPPTLKPSPPPAQTSKTSPIPYVDKWSTADRLTIRTCPSTRCGVTGWVTDGNKVKVYEEKDGWSRIEEPQSAMCVNGKSQMVDSGNAACTAENGIVGGKFARWVASSYLTDQKPKAPASIQGCENLGLVNSDNYRKYSKQFCIAALKMINDGRCKPSDFREWPWSSSPAKGQDYYFTYCGGIQPTDRWYLNIRSGSITN